MTGPTAGPIADVLREWCLPDPWTVFDEAVGALVDDRPAFVRFGRIRS